MVCVVQVIKCGLVTHIKLLRSFCKCRAVTYSYLQATHAKPFGEMTTIWMYPNSPFRCLHLSASLSWQRFFTTVFHCEYPRVEILFLCTRCCDSAARARWENRLWQIPWREIIQPLRFMSSAVASQVDSVEIKTWGHFLCLAPPCQTIVVGGFLRFQFSYQKEFLSKW